METEIRLLLKDDPALPKLAVLMEEMQAYYRVYSPPRDEIVQSIATRPVGAEILICENAISVIGFIAFSGIYPGPGLKPGIFLKELYVADSHRKNGIGRALMRALAGIASRRGLSRIDWTADASDTRLLSFYESLGGEPKPDKLFFRLDGEALEDLAG